MALSGANASTSFSLQIDSNARTTSDTSAAALEKLREAITGDVKALGDMKKALSGLKAAGALESQAAKELQARILAQKAAVAGATNNYLALGGSFRKASPEASRAAKGLHSLSDEAKGMRGPLGEAVGKAHDLVESLTSWRGASIAVAASTAALTAAVLAGAAAVSAYGVSVADARRTEEIQLDALTKMRFGYMGLGGGMQQAADTAGFLQSTIDDVSSKVAIGRDEVAKYEQQFYRMGLRGGNLQEALEGVGIAASIDPTGAAAAQFTNLAMSAGLMGSSIKAVTDDWRKRFGDDVAKRMLSLDVQTKKLHENLRMLFAGVGIEGFLKGLNTVLEMFSESTSTGRALKEILAAIMPDFSSDVTGTAHIVKRFFQGIEFGILDFEDAMLDVRDWWRKAFGSSALDGLDSANLALNLGKDTVIALGAALAVAAGWAVVTAVSLTWPFLLGAAAVAAFIAAGYGIVELWKNLNFASMGHAIVQGIADGINAGAHWVFDALHNLGTKAWAKFKDALGIHSPSRLFAGGGFNIALGTAQGIRLGTPTAVMASRNMGNQIAAAPLMAAPMRESGGMRGGNDHSRKVTMGEVHIHTAETGAAGARDVYEQFVSLLEGESIHMGAAQPKAA